MTFAGRFFAVFFAGALAAAAFAKVGMLAAICGTAGAGGVKTGLETLPNAGFGDCFEHALTASNTPSSAKLAIMANFCWRDQDDSIVPEIVLLVACCVDFWAVDFWLFVFSFDFQVVDIVSPPLRLAQSEVISQEMGQLTGH